MKNDTNTPVTDDDELAKVLDGMNGAPAITDQPADTGADQPLPTPAADGGLQFEETMTETPAAPPVPDAPVGAAAPSEPQFNVPTIQGAAAPAGDLEDIKKDALSELRPLVDKLDLPADEKFDTLLLIIRSTDDQTLVAAAHEAAKAIEDEGKRAAALLDVIKEIDFFANQGK